MPATSKRPSLSGSPGCCLSGQEGMRGTYYKLMDHKLKLKVQWKSTIQMHKHTPIPTHRSPWDFSPSPRPRCSSFVMLCHQLLWGHLLWITGMNLWSNKFWSICTVLCPVCPLLWMLKKRFNLWCYLLIDCCHLPLFSYLIKSYYSDFWQLLFFFCLSCACMTFF